MPFQHQPTLSAPSGYRAHHTGRTVALSMPGCVAAEEPSAHTETDRWLPRHAQRFTFTLSCPRDNGLGLINAPWHGCYQPLGGKGESA